MVHTQSEPVDVGIIIALPEEFEELNNQVKKWRETTFNNHYYHLFERSGYRCVATLIGEMNPTPCAIRTQELIEVWQPETVVLVGISGSLSSDIKVGDVIVAQEVNGYEESGALVDKQENFKLEFGGNHYRTSQIFIDELIHFRVGNKTRTILNEWKNQCSNKLDELLNQENRQYLIDQQIINEDQRPKFKRGHIASGTKVVKSEEFKKLLLSHAGRKLLAVDMESYGFLCTIACKNEDEREKTLIIRGISDSGNKQKTELEKIGDGALRRYAMHNALQFLWAFLKSNSLPHKESKELQNNLHTIAESLKNGNLVFFLGPGINYSPDTLNTASLPPSDITIAEKLSQSGSNQIDLSGLPCEFCPVNHKNRPKDKDHPDKTCPIEQRIVSESSDNSKLEKLLTNEQELIDSKREIKCWAHYILSEHGDQKLSDQLRDILKPERKKYQWNKIQIFLANLAKNIWYENSSSLPLIIATSNYDYGLEKAFEHKRLNIEVISYITEGINEDINSGSFCCGNYIPNPKYEESNDRFNLLESSQITDQKNIIGKIIKLYGGVLYKSNQTQYETFTITESHRINYLRQKEPGEISITFFENLMKKDMLFLGYSENDTDLLMILQRLFPTRFPSNYSLTKNNKGKPRGWLIHQSKASTINDKYWDNCNVKPIKYGWEDFIEEFKETLKAKYSYKFSE